MKDIELGTGLVAVLLLLLVALYVVAVTLHRQRVLGRPGGIPMALRSGTDSNWALGVGRYAGEELWWYNAFRPSRRPSRVIRRADLEITGQRGRRAAEQLLPVGSVIVVCHDAGADGDAAVSLSFSVAAVTGFLSWLEASAPR